MYRNSLVLAIKVNGRILREVGDEVSLPFGCEYSILIKNLDSVRAQVEVSVDDVIASGRGKIIIAPNSDLELERFIRDGNLDSGNRFKFIERTEEIEAHRGAMVDDGVVRVEGWRERVVEYRPATDYTPRYEHPQFRQSPLRGGNDTFGSLGPRRQHPMRAKAAAPPARPHASSRLAAPGITVPGSESSQRFYVAGGFLLEPQSSVLVLHLRGAVGELPIADPVTVHDSPICSTCGKTNRPKHKFCFACGTALQLI